MVKRLSDEENMFETEMTYRLIREGFTQEDIGLSYDADSIFSNISIEPDGRNRKLIVSAELYNPFFGEEDGPELYAKLIEQTTECFKDKTGMEAELYSSYEYCECEDESITLVFALEPVIQAVRDWINAFDKVALCIQ